MFSFAQNNIRYYKIGVPQLNVQERKQRKKKRAVGPFENVQGTQEQNLTDALKRCLDVRVSRAVGVTVPVITQ